MTSNTLFKQDVIGNDIVFAQKSGDELENPTVRPKPEALNVLVNIVSLDGIGGAKVDPTLGTYDVYYRDFMGGGFKFAGDIDAPTTGATADTVDGTQSGLKFEASPYAIKVAPNGVDVAAAYAVHVRQY